MTTPRIASLVPSVTELVAELGLADHLVARTGFCVHPRERLAAVPKVGGTKDVNLPRLRRLAPTHVIVNVDENRRELVEVLRGWGADAPRIVVTHPKSPDDNLALVDQLAAEFAGAPGVAERAVGLRGALHEALAAARPDGRPPRRVLYLIWRGPWMTVARDTYIAQMLARVNWHTWPDVAGGDHGAARYPALNGGEPWLAQIDEVLLSSEPYAFADAHLAEAQALAPQARVRLVDGELLSWYGPRAVPGLAYLRELADTVR